MYPLFGVSVWFRYLSTPASSYHRILQGERTCTHFAQRR